jgi:hypothetical protein
MSKYFSYIIMVCIFFISCAPKKSQVNCSKYKTGSFLLYYKAPQRQDDITFTITRNQSIQTEINSKTGEILTYKIHWVDSCTYQLHFQKSSLDQPDADLINRIKFPLTVTLLAGTDDYYVFEAQREISKFRADTMWIKK